MGRSLLLGAFVTQAGERQRQLRDSDKGAGLAARFQWFLGFVFLFGRVLSIVLQATTMLKQFDIHALRALV